MQAANNEYGKDGDSRHNISSSEMRTFDSN